MNIAHILLMLMALQTPLYPDVADTRHASADARAFFTSFFTAKSRHDVDATMRHFSPELVTYTDATLGWPLDGYDAVKGIFTEYMPKWPKSALSYPTRILGDTRSAVVMFTDTPELFGGELRIIGAVDFRDGKIVRWVDYWDSTSFDTTLFGQMRTPEDKFPTEFGEKAVPMSVAPSLRQTAVALQQAFAAGNAERAAALFTYDAVYEDAALRTQILGRAAIERYLKRILPAAPYGRGSRVRHVVGGASGGGFEWYASPESEVRAGITALELDADGRIQRLTTVYDSRPLGRDKRAALITLASDTF